METILLVKSAVVGRTSVYHCAFVHVLLITVQSVVAAAEANSGASGGKHRFLDPSLRRILRP